MKREKNQKQIKNQLSVLSRGLQFALHFPFQVINNLIASFLIDYTETFASL